MVVDDDKGGSKLDNVRTSSGTFLNFHEDPVRVEFALGRQLLTADRRVLLPGACWQPATPGQPAGSPCTWQRVSHKLQSE